MTQLLRLLLLVLHKGGFTCILRGGIAASRESIHRGNCERGGGIARIVHFMLSHLVTNYCYHDVFAVAVGVADAVAINDPIRDVPALVVAVATVSGVILRERARR